MVNINYFQGIYAKTMRDLPTKGKLSDAGNFTRRRIWARPLALQKPPDVNGVPFKFFFPMRCRVVGR